MNFGSFYINDGNLASRDLSQQYFVARRTIHCEKNQIQIVRVHAIFSREEKNYIDLGKLYRLGKLHSRETLQ